MDHSTYAVQLFLEGYNCAQAVAMAFCDVTGLDQKTAARIASPFGGGMGRMREVCGAVSGILQVAGILYGYDDAADNAGKRALYAQVQAMAGRFREEMGSIVCRDLLKNPPADPNPTPRTAEFYKNRPCARMVETAARIMDDFIQTHPIEK
ncbi:MAG: C_GCAxxG_C_C family protein [Oscillospiraceae bacterium]|nr:C_GCAxxG_C_C family protein [Oscillospiraceae bacterium]